LLVWEQAAALVIGLLAWATDDSQVTAICIPLQ
jgi:hypothetical protein